MPQPDIEHRLEELREYYPSQDHVVLDEALETIRRLREELRRVTYNTTVREAMEDLNPQALYLDGFDDAIVGYANQWGSPPLVVYDGEKIVEILSKDMSLEEAQEFFSYNIECAYVGPGTPLILHRPLED
jgi:hypothetical protein